VERDARDVLDALHQADQHVVMLRPHRREADAAIAHDDGGDAEARRRPQPLIPSRLAIVMGVDVDPAWRDELAFGVDLLTA